MTEFRNRVAVITGAASGIGRSLAERAAQAGMKVVLADVEAASLDQAKRALEAQGANVLAVQVDVSKSEEIEALAHKVLDTFGAIHLLINNAGVGGAGKTIWETSLGDWQWVIGVDLWGVIHGIRTFVPIMLSQKTEGHIVNTASAAGLLCVLDGNYTVAKHGVVALSETLFQELLRAKAKIKVSVLCPGFVRTRILDAGRNRPTEFGGAVPVPTMTPKEDDDRWAALDKAYLEYGGVVSAYHVAEATFAAIRAEEFYIITHTEALKRGIRARLENIINRRNPDVIIP